MFSHISTKMIQFVFFTGILLFILEFFSDGAGLLPILFFFGLFIFIGKRTKRRTLSAVFWWTGWIGLGLTAVTLWAVQFWVIAFFVLLLLQMRRSGREPVEEQAEVEEPSGGMENYDRDELLGNRLWGREKVGRKPFHWKDINVIGGVGDKVVDATNTVLPQQAVIIVRHGLGSVTVYVPYEVNVIIRHSTLYGRVRLFGKEEAKRWNQTVTYHLPAADEEASTLYIFTSLLSGDLEVERR